MMLCGASDIAFVGGSLVERAGHSHHCGGLLSVTDRVNFLTISPSPVKADGLALFTV
ncbi:hypothetical protein [Candidatus Sororendozoicomonas aggregata]|uniref:hypothetical protein n=1 Tax=Candidatus Sororendozoicomonas aggregata TaxID=3073239 RepID=UPI002ED2CB0B